MPPLAAALICAVLLTGCTNSLQDGEGAACAAPTLSVEPASTTAGGQVVVAGENFLGGCPESKSGERDTIAASEPTVPYSDVSIQVLDEGGLVTLAVVDAEDDGTFEAPVPMPEHLSPGVIELTTDVDGTDPTELVIGLS